MFLRRFLLALAFLHVTFGFAPALLGVRTQQFTLSAGQGEREGGGAALAKPDVKVAQTTKVKSKSKSKQGTDAMVHEPISRRKDDFEEAPMYKLMLLGDDSYDTSHVIERMCAIVEGMDEDHASYVLRQANKVGKAMCGKYPFERAELFKEQLLRSDPMIYSEMEDEND